LYIITPYQQYLKKKQKTKLYINNIFFARQKQIYPNTQHFTYIFTKFDNSLVSYDSYLNIFLSSGILTNLLGLSSKSTRKTTQHYITSHKLTISLHNYFSNIIYKPLSLRYFLLSFSFKNKKVFLKIANPTKFKKYRRVKKWLKKDYKKQENYYI
jgi:hypothetical protein